MLRKRKIKNTILNWDACYLLNRQFTINIKGVSILQALKKGTPQGGVLSVILWIIIFDELLILYKGRVEIIGFADDGSLLIRGKKLNKMYA